MKQEKYHITYKRSDIPEGTLIDIGEFFPNYIQFDFIGPPDEHLPEFHKMLAICIHKAIATLLEKTPGWLCFDDAGKMLTTGPVAIDMSKFPTYRLLAIIQFEQVA